MALTSPDDEQVIKRIHLQVKTDPNISDQILSWFEALNQPPLTDQTVWWQCQTALKEGFDNVVDYAHKDLLPETLIEIEAVRLSQSIEIRIWDQGPPFDLKRKINEMPPLDGNWGDRGRGLRIMERIADQLSYDRTSDNRNCLVIIKQFKNV